MKLSQFLNVDFYFSVNSLTVVIKSTDDALDTTQAEPTVQQTGPEFRWDYILIYCALKFLSGSSKFVLL